MCSVIIVATGMHASQPVLHAWLEQASMWGASCSNYSLPFPLLTPALSSLCPVHREKKDCEKWIWYIETFPRSCLLPLLSALQTHSKGQGDSISNTSQGNREKSFLMLGQECIF